MSFSGKFGKGTSRYSSSDVAASKGSASLFMSFATSRVSQASSSTTKRGSCTTLSSLDRFARFGTAADAVARCVPTGRFGSSAFRAASAAAATTAAPPSNV